MSKYPFIRWRDTEYSLRDYSTSDRHIARLLGYLLGKWIVLAYSRPCTLFCTFFLDFLAPQFLANFFSAFFGGPQCNFLRLQKLWWRLNAFFFCIFGLILDRIIESVQNTSQLGYLKYQKLLQHQLVNLLRFWLAPSWIFRCCKDKMFWWFCLRFNQWLLSIWFTQSIFFFYCFEWASNANKCFHVSPWFSESDGLFMVSFNSYQI